MKKNILIIFVLALILFIVGLFFIFKGSDLKESQNTESQKVALEASTSQVSYRSGDAIGLNIKLTNSGEANVCLGKGAIGNIKFVSATKDGNTIKTRTAPSYFLTSFSEILKSRLVSVAPNDSMEFNLTSEFDPGLGVQALSITMPDETSGSATFYNVADPGQYEIQMVYEYVAGASDNCKNILEGKTNTATITFKVE